ncbi:MAG: PilZ domain-containing protein [Deltaproteobacteria bacterium]|nr:PilZ domain-containing protein [Deltaproteobacteria bacterium]
MSDIEEQRVHVRVLSILPCRLAAVTGEFAGVVLDISRGGARVDAPRRMTSLGEIISLTVEIPTSPKPIAIMAEVLRIEEREHADCLGIRFAAIEPKDAHALQTFIRDIDTRAGGDARRHPRYMRHLEVTLTTLAQFQAVMRDVSRGGMGLTCDVPVVLDEAVKVDVQVPRLPRLTLPGKVVHVRSAKAGFYRVGVRFDPLTAETQELLAIFLKSLGPSDDE